jgi:hypothetical protein
MRTKTPTTNWLIEAKTIEDLKALYRKLAFTHHPDLGGNTTTMQEINAEYEFRLMLLQAGQSWGRQNNWNSNNQKSERNSSNYGQGPNNGYQNSNSYQNYNSSYYSSPPPPPSTEKPDPKEAREAFEKVSDYVSKANPWFHVAVLENDEVVAYGRTFPHKDFLRDTGFWWDPERRVWHFVRKPFSPFEQSW